MLGINYLIKIKIHSLQKPTSLNCDSYNLSSYGLLLGKFTYSYDLSFIYAGAEFCFIDCFCSFCHHNSMPSNQLKLSLSEVEAHFFSSHIFLSLESCTNIFGFAFNILHDLSSFHLFPPHFYIHFCCLVLWCLLALELPILKLAPCLPSPFSPFMVGALSNLIVFLLSMSHLNPHANSF